MSLIVEDGSIVTGADSYVTRADYIAYAATLGVTIADEDATDVQLIQAAQYIDSLESQLKGTRVTRDQPLAFPRSDVIIDGWEWEETEIPRQVITAQMALALDINSGEDLYNPTKTLPVVRERVDGAVEVAYANPNVVGQVSTKSRSSALVASLMKRGGLFSIEAMRS